MLKTEHVRFREYVKKLARHVSRCRVDGDNGDKYTALNIKYIELQVVLVVGC